jgi:UDP-N-acetylglucosamine 2-epimerase (non-hydrolysing)
MKVVTILGTRPEIIRLSRITAALDRVCEHVLVHTGQNFDPALSDIFFDQLSVRKPDRFLSVESATPGEQIAKIIAASERVLLDLKPDRVLLLGDTNSALSAVITKRLGIPVYHLEAGNRCFDDRVPEEVNRRVIDHCSDVLMPYTERSRANLLAEGIEGRRIFVVGNPIFEVLEHYDAEIAASDALERLQLKGKQYFLATVHREENVDVEARLRSLVAALERVQVEFGLPVICSTHPRTRARLDRLGSLGADVSSMFHPPFGLFDFVHLERNALCVLTDSGTVQEECCIAHVPNVTLRDVTERPETIECGSNILAGVEPESVLRCVRAALDREPMWPVPPEYVVPHVSRTVANILTAYGTAGGFTAA